MYDFTLIFIAIGLAMDAFAVSIAASIIIGKVSFRQIFRLGFHFGLFQAIMPILGWLAGTTIQDYIASWDHWIAFGLLGAIGTKAIFEACNKDRDDSRRGDPSKGVSMVVLSVAVSIDALAVGLSYAMLNVDIWYPSLIIGIVASAFTVVGMILGGKLGSRFGRKMEILGGIVLLGIGVKILIEHLLV